MSFTVVIPARYASSRLVGKPLLDIAGKPMVQHVYERALDSSASSIIVATDDQRIADCVRGFDGQVLMTSPEHNSGTDRLHEVASVMGFDDEHIVVNLQGDEPLMPAAAIDQVAKNLAEASDASIATLCEKIEDKVSLFDTNVVKVVRNVDNYALYFSRAPLPWQRSWGDFQQALSQLENGSVHLSYRHVGLYAYRVGVLNDFVRWPVSALEVAESLEQLRALENGVSIHCDESVQPIPAGVDTSHDLQRVKIYFDEK